VGASGKACRFNSPRRNQALAHRYPLHLSSPPSFPCSIPRKVLSSSQKRRERGQIATLSGKCGLNLVIPTQAGIWAFQSLALGPPFRVAFAGATTIWPVTTISISVRVTKERPRLPQPSTRMYLCSRARHRAVPTASSRSWKVASSASMRVVSPSSLSAFSTRCAARIAARWVCEG
jgi:hypothetical protein